MTIKKIVGAAFLAVGLAIMPAASAYAAGTYAFQFGNSGGPGQLTAPFGVATDSAKDVYTTDLASKTIKKYSADGTYILSWGGSGVGNGQFTSIFDLTVDSSDNVYVSDTTAHRIQKFSKTGVFITAWGTSGTGAGQFGTSSPSIILAANNQVYVSDTGNNRIEIFSTGGSYLSGFGNSGPGMFVEQPFALASDSAGNIYVLDSNGQTATPSVKKYTSAGVFISSWIISDGGAGTFQAGLAVDRNNDVYISDNYNGVIRQFANDGTDIATFATAGTGNGQLNQPFTIAISSLATGDYLYVADYGNARVQAFKILDPAAVVPITPAPAAPAPATSSQPVVIPTGPPNTGL